MAGFDWDSFYSLIKAGMNGICTVGRYKQPKDSDYPYLDVALKDNSGGNYDLQNVEHSQNPMIELTAYCNNYDDSKCYEISMKVKKLMLAYGFQCSTGPIKIDNTRPEVARWGARYKRVFAAGDKMRRLN